MKNREEIAMKIIGISDIHGDLYAIKKIREEIISADLILIAGDITHFGTKADAEKIISEILEHNTSIVAVSGNCDDKSVSEYLDSMGIGADRKAITLQKLSLTILGMGGSVSTPVRTPNTSSEEEYHGFLEKIETSPDILLIHQPPYNTAADMVMGIKHVGSPAVRSFIDRKKPALCLCGHIHESSGSAYYGKTLVVNPGPFKNGFYSVITAGDSGRFEAELLRI
jgi:uncharacterized protein